jgi:hypothetical protein
VLVRLPKKVWSELVLTRELIIPPAPAEGARLDWVDAPEHVWHDAIDNGNNR